MSDWFGADVSKAVLKAPIHAYRWTLKPLVGHHCRHWPSCSQYALDAIDRNGAWRGFWLTLSRLVRCGPGGTYGVDTVPDIQVECHPFAPWRYGRWRQVHDPGGAAPSARPQSNKASAG
ncbi:MAG TPA: membrane protein insertion efficiency factor YidD [Hyphomicrobium sp.]|nr:membrane protein insertion efficiency factor YidD [Hyphomicrobium sp.]